MKPLALIFFLIISLQSISQTPHTHDQDRAIQFPDIPGYKTLTCDFHQHTVFSDGSVWPDIRVQEAVRDNLDAIAVTEHIEYQPHAEDIPHPDRNRSYQVAEERARPYDLIVINGSEITRDMPPGHSNAIFLEDANKLLGKDSMEVFREAKRQGAFVFWNHPDWIAQRKDGIATVTDMHKQLFQEGLINGIEVVNWTTYSDEALQIALDYNLAIIGTSDIHGLIDWDYKVHEGGHRPVTLVFGKERSKAAIKEGLENRRTAVWFDNYLIGREEFLVLLIQSCLTVTKAEYQGKSTVADVTIKNSSDAEFILINKSDFTLNAHTDIVLLHPNSETTIAVKTIKDLTEFDLTFSVLNAVTAPNTHPNITIGVKVE